MEYEITVVEVGNDNIKEVWPTLEEDIKNASFVALDCELSGLGDKQGLNHPEIDFRFRCMSDIAREYAIVALGVSCFQCTQVTQGTENSHKYQVQTYNILTLCKDDFKIEPEALKFLGRHGFNFQNVYTKGIHHYKGNDRKDSGGGEDVRRVWSSLVQHRKPLVLHNGLLDLLFLYHSLYADLPRKLDTFAADLALMFPHGVYDTKYIAEFHLNQTATFLQYLYTDKQFDNAQRKSEGRCYVDVGSRQYPGTALGVVRIPARTAPRDHDGLDICESFAYHGNCNQDYECGDSHDIIRIVKSHRFEKTQKKKKKKRRQKPVPGSLVHIIQQQKQNQQHGSQTQNEADNNSMAPLHKKNKTMHSMDNSSSSNMEASDAAATGDTGYGCHNAGFDAFMTGFVFAEYLTAKGVLSTASPNFIATSIGLELECNKVYLSRKDFPFLVRVGTYANNSVQHKEKILKIRNNSI